MHRSPAKSTRLETHPALYLRTMASNCPGLSGPLMTARSAPTSPSPASQSVSDMSPRSTSSTTAHTDDSDTSRIRPHTDMSHPATS